MEHCRGQEKWTRWTRWTREKHATLNHVQDVHFVHGVHLLRTGAQGPQGDPGAPGEVTTADLNTAFGGTSANTNAINQLGLIVSDPPTQTELQTVANKLDELIAALRR